ncbi:hypothetical protein F4776DRAFT_639884 [Hypoxylon sp. NC0597]|nr:hypothetical protein F4776DRAFT_639884 [Hypoxylon sp. NC0597]
MVRILQQSPLRFLSVSTRQRQFYRTYPPQPRRAMSSAPNSSTDATTTQNPALKSNENAQHEDSSPKAPLPLPEPTHSGDTTELPVGGEGVKLDKLGPLVVNEDGTMSRIANWAEMAEIERENTLRILGKRNQQRLDALKAKGQTPQTQS